MKKINYINLLKATFILVFVALIVNIVYLAVTGVHFISGKNIAEFSAGREIGNKILYASRGNIYSSDNELLAGDIVSYKLIAYLNKERLGIGNKPAYVTDSQEYTKQLAPILNMSEDKLLEILSQENVYQVEFGTYGNNLTPATKTKIEALELPGLELIAQTKRNYRYGTFASYIIGFASNDENNVDEIVGKFGLESSLNDILTGRNGEIQYIKDSNGYNLPNSITGKIEAQNGDDVHLTINSNVQRDLEIQMARMGELKGIESAWAAVMEAKTGKILAISTYPSFDPNKRDLQSYTDLYLNNPYEVGSVIKPFVYLTALDAGTFPKNETFMSGSFDFKDGFSPVKDWNKVGWGQITYEEGLIRSSNTGMTNLTSKYIPKETLREKYRALGFFKDGWLSGLYLGGGVDNMDASNRDFLSASFGQSSSWTAYQMLRAYSVFANDGCTVEPYIVDYIIDGTTGAVKEKTETIKSEQIFNTDAINYVKDLMLQVVEDKERGTGKQYYMDDIRLFGKTGTGEFTENGKLVGGRYNFSFGGLAPYDDPEVVVFAGVKGVNGIDKQDGVFADVIKTMVRSSIANLNKTTETPSSQNNLLEYTIDNFTNQSVEYASSILKYNNIPYVTIGNGSSVVEQMPQAKSTIVSNSKVFLLTDGNEITMPNMTGWSRKDVSTFEALTNITIEYSGTGKVISQNVAEGTVINSEIAISLQCESG
ncbi:MAG: penicillin-binding protein [Erysipelotrichaceae bacterium]|nr:penicillin-binding protein [Erysipelotrichaceae bacterium]